MRSSACRMLVAAVIGSVAAAAAAAELSNPTPFQQRVQQAMQNPARTPEEKARDPNRLPAETLAFFRMREDMRVIEVLPAGGWYTKILAPLLKEKGKLYVTHPEGFYADAFRKVKAEAGLDAVEEIGWGAAAASGGRGAFGPSGPWKVEPVDLVLTFRNYHNFNAADRATVNKSTFDALKPGGYYGIVDHTRRHNEPDSRANGRRVDPVRVVKEVLDAGFEFVDFSNLHFHAADGLSLEVADASINDRTDRVTLLFRKPVR